MSIIKGVLKNYHLIVMLKKYYLIVVWKSSKVIHMSSFLKIENHGREKLSKKRKSAAVQNRALVAVPALAR